MSTIYILMEKVDLGGDPLVAYSNEAEAVSNCEIRNINDKQAQRDRLLKIGYTQQMADEAVFYREQFYIQEVHLKHD